MQYFLFRVDFRLYIQVIFPATKSNLLVMNYQPSFLVNRLFLNQQVVFYQALHGPSHLQQVYQHQ
jgi:hypothetical protein